MSFIDNLDSGNTSSGVGGNASTASDTEGKLRNQVLSQLVVVLQTLFPQASASISHTATAGGDTLPANPSAFLTITVNSVSYKVPLYNP